jgi:hypothetical protein
LTLVCTVPASARVAEKNETITTLVQESFHAHFKYVTNVSWTQAETLYRACFTQDGKTIYAYFAADGTLVTVAYSVRVDELPIRLQKGLKADLANFRIVELYRMETENGVEYCTTLSNGTEARVLESTYGKWNRLSSIVQK